MNDAPHDPRQDLALVRTDLANERTLLAYGRTALMFAATGVSLIKFFPESGFSQPVGWGLVLFAAGIGILGTVRFARLHQRLRSSEI